MSPSSPPRVFISYTAEDLKAHADVVADVVRKLQWIAIDHRDWAPSGNPSVEECMKQVGKCSVLVVLVAHRYGWVPQVEEGGDGEHSITWLEVRHARSNNIPVLPFVLDDSADWKVSLMEGLKDQTALKRLEEFKAELRKSIAGFFKADPNSLDGEVTRALLLKAELHTGRAAAVEGPAGARGAARGAAGEDEEVIIPWNPDPDNPPSLGERFNRNLPKRILSLDGGGVLSAMTFGYLERIEQALRARYGSPDFKLRDYFDLIGGAGFSTLVAAALALGHEVSTVERLFREIMPFAFEKGLFLFNRLKYLYTARLLAEQLSRLLGDVTLGHESIRTGLCVITTRLDEQRPYPFLNHPSLPNILAAPLSDIVMAAMSFPNYHLPKRVSLGAEGEALLLSGEITVGGDPSLYLLLLATGAAFPLRWRTGKRRLFMLSVGTGELRERRAPTTTTEMSLELPMLQSRGAQYQSRMLLQSLAWDPAAPAPGGGGAPADFAEAEPVLTYRRYDIELKEDVVRDLGLPEMAERLGSLRFDSVKHLDDVITLGQAAAARQVNADHFSRSFDVRKPVGLEG